MFGRRSSTLALHSTFFITSPASMVHSLEGPVAGVRRNSATRSVRPTPCASRCRQSRAQAADCMSAVFWASADNTVSVSLAFPV